MPRNTRHTPGGMVYHVLNRSIGRRKLFVKAEDYAGFEAAVAETLESVPGMRLLGYCVMPTHWHLVLWPRGGEDLRVFMHRLTAKHVRRWISSRGAEGMGHVYHGRYRSFPVQADDHLLRVMRFVESNAKRMKLVRAAERWRWGSLWRWEHRRDAAAAGGAERPALSDWPIERERSWKARVNEPLSDAELAAVLLSVKRGSPYGEAGWVRRTASRLALESTLRPRGRPRIHPLPEPAQKKPKRK